MFLVMIERISPPAFPTLLIDQAFPLIRFQPIFGPL
jgi:hypothetical protein